MLKGFMSNTIDMLQKLEMQKPQILEMNMPQKLEITYAAHSGQHVIYGECLCRKDWTGLTGFYAADVGRNWIRILMDNL